MGGLDATLRAIACGVARLEGIGMSGVGVIDLAVGLAFVLGITSGVSCALTELIARFRGMRGAWLLIGIYQLLDGDDGTSTDLTRAQEDYVILRTALRSEAARGSGAGPFTAAGVRASASPSATGALLGSPILRSQGMTGQISDRRLTLRSTGQEGRLATMQANPTGARWRECRSLPSYIPARSFAEAVIGLLVPGPAWPGTMTAIQQSVDALPSSMSTLRRSLGTLAKSAGGDIGRFRDLVEQWYDDQMERVSGWYERRVSAVTLVIAVLLVLLLNINVVTLGRALYSDAVIRTAASTAAANGASCPAGPEQQACLASLEERVSSTLVAGLPIGWQTIPGCEAVNARCNWLDKRGILSSHGDSGGQVTIIVIGFLVTIAALILGARLWFRLLARFGSLRATGPKPATSASPKSATSGSLRQARSGTEAIMARSRYPWWPVIAAGVVIGGTIAFATYAVRAGVQHLAAGHTPKDAANSLWHLVILSVAAGILSYAVVEFVKRQTRMRSFFNARIVRTRFGKDLDFPQYLRGRLPEDARRSLPLGTGVAISDPISYSGSIQQVTAQISLQLRQLVQLAAARSLDDDLRREALTLCLGLESPYSGVLPGGEGERRAGQLATIQDLIDRRLDIFQIEATQQWCALMRTLSAITAGVLAAISAWAVTSSPSAIVVAALFGIFVGGPMSWITRDLTRVIERKALF